MQNVENSFGGNICRCTGYRAILESFKSFASDAVIDGKNDCLDIEDLQMCPNAALCQNSDDLMKESCDIEEVFDKFFQSGKVTFSDGGAWYHPESKKEIFEILDMSLDNSYMFVGGNTAHGVYRIQERPSVYINISAVPELHTISQDSGSLILGANTSLTDAMNHFYKLAKDNPAQFQYMKVLADHIDLIANVPVRDNYKPPGAKDIPAELYVTLRKKAPNPRGVLRSKATGEPPLYLSVGVVFATHNALESARKESGKTEDWFDLDIPVTGERIWLSAETNFDEFNL